jgi:hypothetical protein
MSHSLVLPLNRDIYPPLEDYIATLCEYLYERGQNRTGEGGDSKDGEGEGSDSKDGEGEGSDSKDGEGEGSDSKDGEGEGGDGQTSNAEKVETEQYNRFIGMAHYLTMNCWRRLWRRINHWWSKGFIMMLGAIRPEDLARTFTMALQSKVALKSQSGRKDESLYYTLNSLYPEQKAAILSHYQMVDKYKAVKHINNLICNLEIANTTNSTFRVYNETTCVEFHHLLLSLLLGYGRALYRLNSAHPNRNDREDNRTPDNREMELRDAVCNYAHFLWRIETSQLYQYHLVVLAEGGWLKLPDPLYADAYTRYAEFNHWPQDETMVPAMEEAFLETAEDDEDDPEGRDGGGGVQGGNVAFVRWLRQMTSHLRAFSILNAGAPPVKPNITLLAVNRGHDRRIKLPWFEAVKNLNFEGSEPFDVPRAIQIIQELIDDSESADFRTRKLGKRFGKSKKEDKGEEGNRGKRGKGKGKQNRSSFKAEGMDVSSEKEEDLCPGELIFTGNLHCEALLASLTKFSDQDKSIGDDLKIIITVRSHLH